MTKTDLFATLRSADPISPADSEAWLRSNAAVAMLERILAEPAAAPPAPPAHGRTAGLRRRRARVVASAVVVVAGGTATAFATGIIGGPAPDPVKQHLAGLDRGMPADLRYNPDLDHARAVAATPDGTLYLADTADGGYCIEVASGIDRPRGASCVTAADLATRPLDITAPIPDSDSSPLLVAGRVNDSRITAVRATYRDGVTVDITPGLDHGWLLEVAPAQHDSALSHGVRISGIDRDGQVVVTVRVPALRDDDPVGTAHDNEQPIVVDTTSNGEDLTLVLAVHGRVNVAGVDRLELRWPDGTTTDIPVAGSGRYVLDIPTSRQNAFADRPGSLAAIRDGQVVATAPVASVAYWRGRNG